MSVAIDLAKPQPEPPTGGEAQAGLSCAVIFFAGLLWRQAGFLFLLFYSLGV
jgi:hypothetical protein